VLPPSPVVTMLPSEPIAKHVVEVGQLIATSESPLTPVASEVHVIPASDERAASPFEPVA
jgi:hypothetical protein